jgi:hypothetical protein
MFVRTAADSFTSVAQSTNEAENVTSHPFDFGEKTLMSAFYMQFFRNAGLSVNKIEYTFDYMVS